LNSEALDRVVLMVLGMEGCLIFRKENLGSRESFDKCLNSPQLMPE
jgi:hypothetical protein